MNPCTRATACPREIGGPRTVKGPTSPKVYEGDRLVERLMKAGDSSTTLAGKRSGDVDSPIAFTNVGGPQLHGPPKDTRRTDASATGTPAHQVVFRSKRQLGGPRRGYDERQRVGDFLSDLRRARPINPVPTVPIKVARDNENLDRSVIKVVDNPRLHLGPGCPHLGRRRKPPTRSSAATATASNKGDAGNAPACLESLPN